MGHPLAAIAGISLALTLACGPQGQSAPQQATSGAQTESPQYGGLFHVPARPTFEGKDPFKGPTGSQVSLKSRPVYEPLVAYKLEPAVNFRVVGEVVPWLAESWQQPSPTEYVFKLREGVKFHDGVELTAEDIVFSFKRAADPKTQYGYGAALREVMKDIEAVDKYRVRFILTGPAPDVLFDVVADYVKILPKHLEQQGQSFEQVANGTGPYKMVTLDNSKGITFEKNQEYWDKGRPYMDGIVVHKGLDDSTIVAAMSTGRIDVYNPPLLPDLQQTQSMVRSLQHVEYTEAYSNAVFMKLDRAPFNDIRVRRALHLALDRQRLIELALFGRGMLAPPSAQPDLKWAIPQEELLKLPGYRQPKTQDVAEAKRLLAEAGYAQGFKFEIKYRPTLTSSNSIAEPLATAWRDIGVEVTLRPEESGVFEQSRRQANYEALLTTTGEEPFDTFLDHYYSKGVYAGYGVNDPALDALILASQTEPDQAKRLQMALEMQRTVLDKIYGIPTVERKTYAAWQPWLKNYLFNPGAQVIPFYTPASTWIDASQLPDFRKGEKLPF